MSAESLCPRHAMIANPKPGDVIEVAPYPFVRCTVDVPDDEGGYCTIQSWRPGVEFEAVPPDDSEAVADDVGAMLLTVVARFKPGKYPERIFYTRQFRRPDGAVFGKTNLRVTTLPAFRRKCYGYAMHLMPWETGYRIRETSEAAA